MIKREDDVMTSVNPILISLRKSTNIICLSLWNFVYGGCNQMPIYYTCSDGLDSLFLRLKYMCLLDFGRGHLSVEDLEVKGRARLLIKKSTNTRFSHLISFANGTV